MRPLNADRTCSCGSGQPRRDLLDAAGTFCTYVCDACENMKRSKYRAEIFDASHPYASSGKEEDLEVDHEWKRNADRIDGGMK